VLWVNARVKGLSVGRGIALAIGVTVAAVAIGATVVLAMLLYAVF
jgi:uncharacterized membrane protein (DUF485 family)